MTRPGKNVFDLSHDVKMSARMGRLTPTLCMECIPGDKINIGCDSLIRFAPMVAPPMHRIDARMEYFFVPNRLLWDGWENFITQTPRPGDLIPPAFPFLIFDDTTVDPHNLADYLGLPLPLGGATTSNISALPFVAYQLIYNSYYRDQNLSDDLQPKAIDGDNGINLGMLMNLRLRAWEHDYFTSALPFAQKGAGVDLPLAGFQDIEVKVNRSSVNTTANIQTSDLPGVTAGVATAEIDQSENLNVPLNALYADTSELQVGSTTINDLRRAFRLQEWLEKAARGGSRYIEQIKSFFGVQSSDKRLDRPEYIYGTKSPVIISEVLNSSDTDNAPQGQMSGHGLAAIKSGYGGYFVEEHGYIIGIMSVMPKTAYFQGIPKHFTKIDDAFQYYFPQFANIGEQEILVKEIFAGVPTQDDVFGYIPRYSEYKFLPNRVAGEFRTTLDHWHLARKFASVPALSEEFIQMNSTETDDRIFAVTAEATDNLYCHILHKIKAVRPIPKYGTPSF